MMILCMCVYVYVCLMKIPHSLVLVLVLVFTLWFVQGDRTYLLHPRVLLKLVRIPPIARLTIPFIPIFTNSILLLDKLLAQVNFRLPLANL